MIESNELTKKDILGPLSRFKVLLKILRKNSNFTQEQMSQKLCMSTRNYQRLESGESIPALDTLIKISTIFEVDTSLFFSEEKKDEKIFRVINEKELLEQKNGIDFHKLTKEIESFIEKSKDQNIKLNFNKIAKQPIIKNFNHPLFFTDWLKFGRNKKLQSIFDIMGQTKDDLSDINNWKEKLYILSSLKRIYGHKTSFGIGEKQFDINLNQIKVQFIYKTMNLGLNDFFVIGMITNVSTRLSI